MTFSGVCFTGRVAATSGGMKLSCLASTFQQEGVMEIHRGDVASSQVHGHGEVHGPAGHHELVEEFHRWVSACVNTTVHVYFILSSAFRF